MSSLLTDGQIYTTLVSPASLHGYSSLFTKQFTYETFQNGYQKSARMLVNWSGSHGDTRFFWSKISEVWESLVLLNKSSSQNFQHIFRSPLSRVTEDLLSKYDTVPERTKRGFLSFGDYFDSIVGGRSWFSELCFYHFPTYIYCHKIWMHKVISLELLASL